MELQPLNRPTNQENTTTTWRIQEKIIDIDNKPKQGNTSCGNNGVLHPHPESILAFNLVSPLQAHFLQGPPSPTTGRRKRISFDIEELRDAQRRSSILSAVQRSRNTILRYIEIERVIMLFVTCTVLQCSSQFYEEPVGQLARD